MIKYIKTLYDEAIGIFGPAPENCKYAIIGLGSMALGQITPYSDLEFAILIEKDSPEIQNYFKKLSYYVNFKIICLGETAIPENDYDINLDDLIGPAVNFDLGGKTPLGRWDGNGDYELIATPEKILEYLKNYNGPDTKLQGILETSCFISGDEKLAGGYQQSVQGFLILDNGHGKSHFEARAIKALDGESGNISQFTFKASIQTGKLFDVKQEIYRLPDRFIYNLAKIDQVQENNSWDSINKLAKNNTITRDAASNLKNALSFACMLRLRIYDYYECQNDTMDVFPIGSDDQKIFRLTNNELQENGKIFQFYHTALDIIYLFDLMSRKLDYKNWKNYFKDQYLNKEQNVTHKALINFRLMRYEEANKYLAQEAHYALLFGQQEVQMYINALHDLGLSCGHLGNLQGSLQYTQLACEIVCKLEDNHPSKQKLSMYYSNIGKCFNDLAQEEYNAQQKQDYAHKAIDTLKIALEYLETEYSNTKNKLEYKYAKSHILNNLAHSHCLTRNHDTSNNIWQEALELLADDSYESRDLKSTILNNFAAQLAEGQYEYNTAIEKHLDALHIRSQIYTFWHPNRFCRICK